LVTAFFDTSAIVPLILREPHSQAARTVWDTAEECYAWKWLKVETEAALVRRKAPAPAWQLWRTIEASMSWVEPEGDSIEPLKTFNRGVALRAADAGHLFVMEHCATGLENLVLVTFDSEMTMAAQRRGLALFTH
jgi:predicted nucleic acid-binding protein